MKRCYPLMQQNVLRGARLLHVLSALLLIPSTAFCQPPPPNSPGGPFPPTNPCPTAGLQWRDTSTNPVTFYWCGIVGRNWVGPFALASDVQSITPANVPSAYKTGSGAAFQLGTPGGLNLIPDTLDGSIPAARVELGPPSIIGGLSRFIGDDVIFGDGDVTWDTVIEATDGHDAGTYFNQTVYNPAATPTKKAVGDFFLEGHYYSNGVNAVETFGVEDTSTGNPTSGKTLFYINLDAVGDGRGTCTHPCSAIDSGGTFFVGKQVATNVAVNGAYLSLGSTPGISGCGSGASIVGTNSRGTITLGTGPGSCVLSFTSSYGSDPACVVGFEAGTAGAYSHSTANITITATGLSGKVDYLCIG